MTSIAGSAPGTSTSCCLRSLLAAVALAGLVGSYARGDALVQANDRLVFLGDEITMEGKYTYYIEEWVKAYQPELRVQFFNAGMNGDTADNGLARFSASVLSHSPQVVVICYGMNDAKVFSPNAPVDPVSLQTYLDSHEQMIDVCRTNNISPFLMTSPCASPDLGGDLEGHNARLEVYADSLIGLAAQENVPIGDLFHMLLNREERYTSLYPGSTLIPDGLHPGDVAGELIALEALVAWNLAPFANEDCSNGIDDDADGDTDCDDYECIDAAACQQTAAATGVPLSAPRFLQPNDRVVFLGDSITYRAVYTGFIEKWVAGHQPELLTQFFNAGVGSDSAPSGLARFQSDVLVHSPTVVTFCYGMNDAVNQLPNGDIAPGALAAYISSHQEMINICRNNGIRPFLMTSPPARPDLTGTLENHNLRLEVLAEALRDLAEQEDVPFVDIFHPLLTKENRYRALYPPYSLIPDGVHPGDAMCLLMALEVLSTWSMAPFPGEKCGNGVDDDADGDTDCLDYDCTIVEPCAEFLCNDGLDGDNDGLTDCADPDCSDRVDCPEDCANSIDDDADGDIDCADIECVGVEPCVETECGDGLDGDNDGLTDCADPDCSDNVDCPEICDNSIDDDADGDVDCDDSECTWIEPCVETECDDGLDGDNDGLTDCDDPDCSASPLCPEDCTNGVDDDADGLTDCDDPECSDHASCVENCTNGVDDDADGDVDCADAECRCHPSCDPQIGPEICDNGIDDDCNGLTDGYDPTCPFIVSMTVYDGGDYDLDGNVGPTTAPNPTFVIGTPGTINSQSLYYVSKFKLDTILPTGTAAEDVVSATLTIPDQDLLRNGNPGAYMMHLYHFATVSDTIIAPDDGGYGVPISPALIDYGGVLGGRQPLQPDVNRFVHQDVAAAIKDDLANGRALASFRIGHRPEDAALLGSSHNYQIGDSNAIDQGLGDAFAPPNGDGVMKLTIELTVTVPPTEVCDNGTDDDEDGLTDCDDPDCSDDPACPENCTNGIDDDADGDIDCDDSECASIEPCMETICGDGLDGDNDGLTDCADPDCFGQAGCTIETICNDGLDNDADGQTDCDDLDCEADPHCGPRYPDLDADGDVDQSDFGQMQVCLTGSYAWVGPECEYTDFDEDGHVDQYDVETLMNCMAGANVPAGQACTP